VSPGNPDDAALRAMTAQAFRRLGVHALMGTPLFSQAFGCARTLTKRGVSKDMMTLVVSWALKRRSAGDPFPHLLNLVYLWGKNFPTLLAAAQQPVPERPHTAARTFTEPDKWAQRVAERRKTVIKAYDD
jgi:hypothetical protein